MSNHRIKFLGQKQFYGRMIKINFCMKIAKNYYLLVFNNEMAIDGN